MKTLMAADGRLALIRIMQGTTDEAVYAYADIAYKTIDALDAHRCIPDEATLAAALRSVPGEYDEYTPERLAAALRDAMSAVRSACEGPKSGGDERIRTAE